MMSHSTLFPTSTATALPQPDELAVMLTVLGSLATIAAIVLCIYKPWRDNCGENEVHHSYESIGAGY